MKIPKQPHEKGYECSYNEGWVKDMILEGEQRQPHVGKDEILRQKIEKLKQLKWDWKGSSK